jgi:hypothetical protein
MTTMRRALLAMVAEFEKLTRYGSPLAREANEALRYARAALAEPPWTKIDWDNPPKGEKLCYFPDVTDPGDYRFMLPARRLTGRVTDWPRRPTHYMDIPEDPA